MEKPMNDAGAGVGARAGGEADAGAGAAYFRAKLQFEIDVMDVADATPGSFVLVDTRRQSSWDHGHVPGAAHFPTAEIPARAAGLIPAGSSVVVYSWGPGCNGSTFAALAFAELGYPVREMIGGCSGLTTRKRTSDARIRVSPDYLRVMSLSAPAHV